MAPAATYQVTIDPEFVLPPQPHFPDDKKDLRDTIQHDPELAAIIREEAEIIIASRLAGIPRPRYIPATSLANLKGLEVYAARNRQSFPFAFYLNGLLLAWELMGQIVIFAIATNIVPAQYFSKRYVEYTARGVMVVTMLLVLLWAILFMLD